MIKKIDNFLMSFEKKYNILTYISFFMIFAYVYNIGFKEYIFPNQIVIIFYFFVAGVFLFLANYGNIRKQGLINSKNKVLLGILLSIFLLILIRNGDIINGHYGAPFYSLFAVFLVFVLSYSNKWYKIFNKIILFFTIEHIFATIFCFIFPNIYLNNILPVFSEEVRPLLLGQFNAGEIAGITCHYSTNALYLVVGFIINAFNLDLKNNNKKKKFYILYLIVNFFALLLTGKRVQVFFSIFAILVVLFVKNRNNIKNFIKKFLITVVVATILVLFVSIFVPNVLTPVKRTIEGITSGNLFDTRKPLYELAINKISEDPIIGQGWGNYKYVYNKQVINKEMDLMDTHNIYLQLFCEIGVFGFLLFVYIFLYLLISGIKSLKNIDDRKMDRNKYICMFLAFHIYFLMEGLLGNPLYDIMIYIPYACLTSMYFTILSNSKQ